MLQPSHPLQPSPAACSSSPSACREALAAAPPGGGSEAEHLAKEAMRVGVSASTARLLSCSELPAWRLWCTLYARLIGEAPNGPLSSGLTWLQPHLA